MVLNILQSEHAFGSSSRKKILPESLAYKRKELPPNKHYSLIYADEPQEVESLFACLTCDSNKCQHLKYPYNKRQKHVTLNPIEKYNNHKAYTNQNYYPKSSPTSYTQLSQPSFEISKPRARADAEFPLSKLSSHGYALKSSLSSSPDLNSALTPTFGSTPTDNHHITQEATGSSKHHISFLTGVSNSSNDSLKHGLTENISTFDRRFDHEYEKHNWSDSTDVDSISIPNDNSNNGKISINSLLTTDQHFSPTLADATHQHSSNEDNISRLGSSSYASSTIEQIDTARQGAESPSRYVFGRTSWADWFGDSVDNVVTIKLFYATVAQKSYGNEKRFLCPPPAIVVWGLGETATTMSQSHVEINILPSKNLLFRTAVSDNAITGDTESNDSIYQLNTGNRSPRSTRGVTERQITVKSTILNRKTQYAEELNSDRRFSHSFEDLSYQAKSKSEARDGLKHTNDNSLHYGNSIALKKLNSENLKALSTNQIPSSYGNHYVDSYNYALFRSLYVADSGKSKEFKLRLSFQLPNGFPGLVDENNRSIVEITSGPLQIISKPSKKMNSLRSKGLCINQGSAVCLYNRINSQTYRTKFMNVDRNTGKWSAISENWSAFKISVVDINGIDISDMTAPLSYGSYVVLESHLFAFRSPIMIARKVDCGKLINQSSSPVCQMQKIALELLDTEKLGGSGKFLCTSVLKNFTDLNNDLKTSASSVKGAKANQPLSFVHLGIDGNDNSDPNKSFEISDNYCWTIVCIECASYTFSFPRASGSNPMLLQQKQLLNQSFDMPAYAKSSQDVDTGPSPLRICDRPQYNYPVTNYSINQFSNKRNNYGYLAQPRQYPTHPVCSERRDIYKIPGSNATALPKLTQFPDLPDLSLGFTPLYVREANKLLCLISGFDPHTMKFMLSGNPITELGFEMAPEYNTCQCQLKEGNTIFNIPRASDDQAFAPSKTSQFPCSLFNSRIIKNFNKAPVNPKNCYAQCFNSHICNSSKARGYKEFSHNFQNENNYEQFMYNRMNQGSCSQCACGCASISPCSSCSSVPTSLSCSAGNHAYLGVFISLPGSNDDPNGQPKPFGSGSNSLNPNGFNTTRNSTSRSFDSPKRVSSSSYPVVNLEDRKVPSSPKAYPLFISRHDGINHFLSWAVVFGDKDNVEVVSIPNVI